MPEYSWAYHCGACGRVIDVDDINAHVQEHRTARDYDGHIDLRRVDLSLELGVLTEDRRYLCGGCAVREPHEHRCHRADGPLPCSCEECSSGP